MGFMKMQVFASMTHGFEEAAKNGQASSELDEIKRMLTETNPYFLALTALVSVLHMVYVPVPQEDLQATTNWRLYILGLKCWPSRMMWLTGGRRRSWWACRFERYGPFIVPPILVLMSSSQIVTNVVVQAIILLYLLDNNADTSWMILFGQGMGIIIEAWKVTKAVDIQLVRAPVGSKLPYTIAITGEPQHRV